MSSVLSARLRPRQPPSDAIALAALKRVALRYLNDPAAEALAKGTFALLSIGEPPRAVEKLVCASFSATLSPGSCIRLAAELCRAHAEREVAA